MLQFDYILLFLLYRLENFFTSLYNQLNDLYLRGEFYGTCKKYIF